MALFLTTNPFFYTKGKVDFMSNFKPQTKLIFALFLSSSLLGLLNKFLQDYDYVAFTLLIAFISMAWHAMDCNNQGFKYNNWLAAGIFLLPVIFLPVHLLQTRKLRGFISITFAIIIFIAAALLHTICEELVFYISP